jgi:uncharacterized protein (DUF1330 family)
LRSNRRICNSSSYTFILCKKESKTVPVPRHYCLDCRPTIEVPLTEHDAKPPIYYIAEVDVTDIDAYTKEYAPRAQALIKSMGGRVLAAGQKVTALQGDPPKPRVALIQWESMEKVHAWRDTPEFKELRKIGDK